jgi:transketolase N-terminal domain/subunit
MALRRAAELTVQNGYQWFNVVSRYTDLADGSYSPTGPTIGIGGSSGSFGSGIGVGVGFNFGGNSRQYEATLEILMGRGAKPADPSTYDAQQVLNRPM